MLVLGHRGASGAHGDNTLAAFLGAVAQGADGVELDVRRTRDGGLALVHDESLPDGRLVALTARAELPPDVVLLDEALDACAPLAVVNIEIKNWPADRDFDPTHRLADDVVATLEARGELRDGRAIVSCFHLETVDRVHELAPGLATAWLPPFVDDAAALVETVAGGGHVAVHPHHVFVNEELVRRAHDAGLAVNTWTCDDPDRIRWLADLGVDAVVTNFPDLALSALGR